MDDTNPNQPLYYIQIANNIGCPMRALLLIMEECDHSKMGMERFLKTKEQGDEIWRSITEGPHVRTKQNVGDFATQTTSQNQVREAHVTSIDVKKMCVDDVAFTEMVFGVPPSLSQYIKLCKSTKYI